MFTCEGVNDTFHLVDGFTCRNLTPAGPSRVTSFGAVQCDLRRYTNSPHGHVLRQNEKEKQPSDVQVTLLQTPNMRSSYHKHDMESVFQKLLKCSERIYAAELLVFIASCR